MKPRLDSACQRRHAQAHSDAPAKEAVRETKRHLGCPRITVSSFPTSTRTFRQSVNVARSKRASGTICFSQYQAKHSELSQLCAPQCQAIFRRLGTHTAGLSRSESDGYRAAAVKLLMHSHPMPMLMAAPRLGPQQYGHQGGGDFEASSPEGNNSLRCPASTRWDRR